MWRKDPEAAQGGRGAGPPQVCSDQGLGRSHPRHPLKHRCHPAVRAGAAGAVAPEPQSPHLCEGDEASFLPGHHISRVWGPWVGLDTPRTACWRWQRC